MKYIVKVAPEITIKSKPVRKQCIKLLAKNIKIHLDRFDGFFEVRFTWDRIDIDFAFLPDLDQEIQSILKNIPGIGTFMEVENFPLLASLKGDNTIPFEDILEKVSDFYLDKITGKTFAVRVNRSGTHIFSSIDVEKYV
jgi:thiamine biosynthesis protein ThiI